VSDIEITTLAERPGVIEQMYDFSADVWPEFMFHDRLGDALMYQVFRFFPEQCVVATQDDEVVAHGRSIPFVFPDEDRKELPDGGWDQVLVWGVTDHRRERETTASSALEIVIRPSHAGTGLSYLMLAAMKDAVRRRGHDVLYAPVRPNGKTDPDVPMSAYITMVRDDGLPVDPWLRVHVRSGAEIVKVAPTSMVIAGSLAEWRQWTGLPFDTDGDVHVPKALAPVHCSLAHDRAVYVEPNVWVRHDLT
jgi:GNAT superfamily N-acetyltransferase